MALSKRLAMYADIHAVLEAAVEHGGGRILLPTAGKAQHWCQRANYYRKLLHKQQVERSGLDDLSTTTPYDAFTFARDPEDKAVVTIAAAPMPLSFTAPDGTEVNLERATEQLVATVAQSDEDDLLSAAEDFAATLTGKTEE